MNVSAAQIRGRRARQEDAFCHVHFDDGDALLAAVADGLGGHPGGDVASRLALETFQAEFAERHRAGTGTAREWIQGAVLAAHTRLLERQRTEPALAGMATTLVSVYLRDARLWAATVGDSYLLLLRGERLALLNELHTEQGGITSSIGFNLTRVDLADGLALAGGDRLLLATDGLAPLGDEDIGRILGSSDTPDAAAHALVEAVAALDQPAQDNATALVIFP